MFVSNCRGKNIFLVFHLGVPTKKEKIWWLDGGLTRKLPRANMIKYSLEILLFTKVKRAQPDVSSLCKLGYSAQFSITAPTELNTLCFTSTLIHYTSAMSSTQNQLQLTKVYLTYKWIWILKPTGKILRKSMTCLPLFYIKKIENLNTIYTFLMKKISIYVMFSHCHNSSSKYGPT